MCTEIYAFQPQPLKRKHRFSEKEKEAETEGIKTDLYHVALFKIIL